MREEQREEVNQEPGETLFCRWKPVLLQRQETQKKYLEEEICWETCIHQAEDS